MLEQLLSNPIMFDCFFVCLWCLVCSIISLLGGWFAISKKYPRQKVICGRLFPFTAMGLGLAKYSACLFIRVGDEGLDISVFLPFRFLHPPLLIPWNAFDSCKRTKFIFTDRLQLSLKNPKYSFYFRGKLADEIEKCYQQFAEK